MTVDVGCCRSLLPVTDWCLLECLVVCHCLSVIGCYLFSYVALFLWFVCLRLLPVPSCSFAVWCWLFVVCCLLFVACLLLFVVFRSLFLFVVCSWLSVKTDFSP